MNNETTLTLRGWWRRNVLVGVDHPAVLDAVREDAGWSGRYAFMILMSAGIAVLGLLLSSPAVVIGAMLISPLMGPIIGLGFAVATFDVPQIQRAVLALVGGVALAVAFCALVVLLSPIQNVTSEIAARTRPNLFDLVIALFSALAGAYATIRGRAGTVVGVAIATALMPPLAVVGFGLATGNGSVFSGALLLFFTNLMTIALAAAAMARFYGFGPGLSPHQTILQTLAALAIFVSLAVPLGFSLRQVAWEALASRQARAVLDAEFAGRARISQVEMDYNTTPLTLNATVFTPDYHGDAAKRVGDTLARLLGRPVTAKLEQYRVGGADAENAQIAAAADTGARNAGRRDDLAQKLALVAGVSPDAVTIDSGARRAVVTARPIRDAGIAVYRALEARVAEGADGWTVLVTPPLVDLGTVSMGDDGPDADGQAAIDDAAWAAQRLNLPITVSGTTKGADAIATRLTAEGTTVVRGPATGAPRLDWQLTPRPVASPAR